MAALPRVAGAAAAALLCVLCLCGTACSAPPARLSSSPASLPRVCLSGLNLVTICKSEYDVLLRYFNISELREFKTLNLTTDDVSAYLAQEKEGPTAACCRATCPFNCQYCSCWPQVISITRQLLPSNPNLDLYATFNQAERCRPSYKLYLGSTCPLDYKTAAPDPNPCIDLGVNATERVTLSG